MARKKIDFIVTDEGRDKGKHFVITEMDADLGEDWAMRALLAMAQSGVDLPEGFMELGMAGIAQVGLKALFSIKFETAKPLMDELMNCIEIRPDPRQPQTIRPIWKADTEEIVTRTKLKWEVLKVHVDFSQAADLSKSVKGAAARVKRNTATRMSQSS